LLLEISRISTLRSEECFGVLGQLVAISPVVPSSILVTELGSCACKHAWGSGGCGRHTSVENSKAAIGHLEVELVVSDVAPLVDDLKKS